MNSFEVNSSESKTISPIDDSAVNSCDDLNPKEHQEVRAFLRERYLRAITFIVGSPCDFNLVTNGSVTGVFSGSDTESKRFYVKNLATPIGVVSDALLRSEDIVSLHVSGINI